MSDWTPDQKLRADATDEQLIDRRDFFARTSRQWPDVLLAREFAEECVVSAHEVLRETFPVPCAEPGCALPAEWCRYHALRVPCAPAPP